MAYEGGKGCGELKGGRGGGAQMAAYGCVNRQGGQEKASLRRQGTKVSGADHLLMKRLALPEGRWHGPDFRVRSFPALLVRVAVRDRRDIASAGSH